MIQLLFIANILVAGYVGYISLFGDISSVSELYSGTVHTGIGISFYGTVVLVIALLSIVGLLKPDHYNFIFLIQLLYKGQRLIIIALPYIIKNGSLEGLPGGFFWFFIIRCIALPFVIDWSKYR